MVMKAEQREKTLARVKKLARLAEELRQGEQFQITRLTMLKSLCEDPVAAAELGLYLVEQVKTKAKKRYRPLIDKAVREIRQHLRKPAAEPRPSLWDALEALEHCQKEVEHQRWADVRIVRSREALLAEYALRCVARPRESAHHGYHLARVYAERYDPRYGTGLIPASADAVEDIVRFWSPSNRPAVRPEAIEKTNPILTAWPHPGRATTPVFGRSLCWVGRGRSLHVRVIAECNISLFFFLLLSFQYSKV
jgi:NOL1/NOP2/fmu family ribosome biogenesis protein